MAVKKLGIFCGSSSPKDSELFDGVKIFLEDLFKIGQYDVVYGGANIGIMGEVADISLKNNRFVYGVMPGFLQMRKVDHRGLSDFEVCETMHERKEKMYGLSDAFLVLPGGFGTLDEFFEILTWRQLSLHQKPIFLLNTNGFYDGLISHIDKMCDLGLISHDDRAIIKIVTNAQDLS